MTNHKQITKPNTQTPHLIEMTISVIVYLVLSIVCNLYIGICKLKTLLKKQNVMSLYYILTHLSPN